MLILEGPPSPVYSLAFSPDGLYLASAHRTGNFTVHVWDSMGGSAGTFTGWTFNSLCFSPDGDVIAAGNGIRRSAPNAEPLTGDYFVRDYSGPQPIATGAAFVTPTILAVGYGNRAKSEAGVLMLRDYPSGKPRKPEFTEPHGVRSVAGHPPTKTVAWSNASRRISVWDVTKSAPVHFNLTHSSPAVAFHPYGKELVAAVDYTVRVYELARRFERLNLKGHRGQVTSVAVTPDGRTIVSGSWDGTVKLWDAETGAETATFQWPTGKVYAVACAPDGTRMAAAGEKGTVVVWDTE